ncbi:hypothetical protein VPNG_07416 [Cytospora leucostoma]|uniref:Uncharacterized protein n=1 Tax=Cytospora leucostoma TaxID=1230097 RepID=A0A423WMN1_9PEZI|nr:hypothetical protein VPNG_07416 [Cytospora leucostoma]
MDSSKPLAPRHPREDLHRFVNELNVRYSIGIPIPDPSISPSKRREQGSISTRLYTRLEVHFYQGGVEALHSLTQVFDREAKELWSNWVKKPKGDPDTLPRIGSVFFATNNAERERLQSLFHQVLDQFQPTRSFGRTQSGPAAYSMEKATQHSKRAADADIARTPTKRSRPVTPHASTTISEAADIFAAPKFAPDGGSSRPGPARTAEALNKSFSLLKSATTMGSSMGTSKTSFRSVFSYEQPGAVSTQETVEPSTQERRWWPGLSFQDTGEPASVDKEVLHMPSDDYETSIPNPSMNNARPEDAQVSPTQNSYHSIPTTSYKDLSDLIVDAQSKVSGQVQYSRPRTAEPPNEPLQSQMHRIWPQTPTWLEAAPFPVMWEVMRIAQYCAVDLGCISMTYNTSWTIQKKLRSAI